MKRRCITTGFAALVALSLASAAHPAEPTWNRADMDTTCAPCRDFYQYANGGWLARTTMPPGFGRYGSFTEVDDHNKLVLRRVLERAAADRTAKPGSRTQRLGDYYAACLDSAAAERAGLDPVKPHLAAIDAMSATADLATQLGWLHAHGIGGGFRFGAGPDPMRSSITIVTASQGGLGMPEREYYFRDDSASTALRAEYTAHVERVFRLLGRADAAAEARRVVALETRLARASMTRAERRDPRAVYHKVPFDSLRAWTPGFDWNGYLARRGIHASDSVNVAQPAFFKAFATRLADVPLADWQADLRWQVMNASATMLSSAFADEDFAWRRQLTGASERLPRWQRCINQAQSDLSDLVGQAYIDDQFPPAARQRAMAMVHRLEAALGARIAAVDWMSDTTKAAARRKLDAFTEQIGAPGVWRDYAGLSIGRASWSANAEAARAWQIAHDMARLGKPPESREWGAAASVVNAFYSSSYNSINFPAGILQPPFYDPAWDDALNYGGIGAVIGHEMSHGFDDSGRQFDPAGNLRDWWTAADANRYKERARRVAEQFDGYTVLDSLHLNGKATLGENIGDLGGLAVAYAALEEALKGQPRVVRDGFTPEQRFFLSYARVWRALETPEDLRTRVASDAHSPPMWRVNGPLSNLDEFARAFGCKAGDAMVRPEELRARIW